MLAGILIWSDEELRKFVLASSSFSIFYTFLYKIFEKNALIGNDDEINSPLYFLYHIYVVLLIGSFLLYLIRWIYSDLISFLVLAFGFGLIAIDKLTERKLLLSASVEVLGKLIFLIVFLVYEWDFFFFCAMLLPLFWLKKWPSFSVEVSRGFLKLIYKYHFQILISFQSLLIKRIDIFIVAQFLSGSSLVVYKYAQMCAELVYFFAANNSQILMYRSKSYELNDLLKAKLSGKLFFVRIEYILFLAITSASLLVWYLLKIDATIFMIFFSFYFAGAVFYISVIPFQIYLASKGRFDLIFVVGIVSFFIGTSCAVAAGLLMNDYLIALIFMLVMLVARIFYGVIVKIYEDTNSRKRVF